MRQIEGQYSVVKGKIMDVREISFQQILFSLDSGGSFFNLLEAHDSKDTNSLARQVHKIYNNSG